MKKNVIFFVILLAILTSCATTVRVQTLAPSDVNLGANQVIAVASTSAKIQMKHQKAIPVYVEDKTVPVPQQLTNLEPSERFNTVSKVADYAADMIYSALSEGVYSVVNPATTDKYLKSSSILRNRTSALRENGVTLLLESSLDGVTFDEYITGRAVKNKNGTTYYNYYLVQKASLSLSYRLEETATGRIVDAKAYTGTYPSWSYEDETLIARVDEKGNFKAYTNSFTGAERRYYSILDSFRESIRDRLVPHVETLSFNLLSDPANKDFDEINKLVKEGYLNVALDKYTDIYQRTANTVAGCNCAILTYAAGNPAGAISLVQNIYLSTLDSNAGKLLQKMKNAYASQMKAISQVTN